MAQTKIEETSKNREYWLSRPYLSASVRQSLGQSKVLLVPQEGIRGKDVCVFPVRTEEFFGHLKEKLPADLPIEIAINNDDYKEAALHSALLILGSIVVAGVSRIVVPVIVNVVSEHLKRRLLTDKDQKETTVRWELTVVDGHRAAKITYDGSAIDFQAEMQKALSQIPSALQSSPTPPTIEEKPNDEKSG